MNIKISENKGRTVDLQMFALFIERVVEANIPPTWDVYKEILEATNTEYFAAWDNNNLVGVLALSRSSMDWSVYELHTHYILPEYQQKGIGRSLVKTAIDFCRDQDRLVTAILLSTHIPE